MTLALESHAEPALSSESRNQIELPAREAEQQLVCSLQNGEDSAYQALLRMYGPYVMGIARRYLQCEADAADCFQDTFVAVFQSIGSYRQHSSLRQWIRGVTINKCLMKLRSRQRRREESIDHMLPMFDERGKRVEVASPRQKGELGESLDAGRTRRIVRENIDKLPGDYRLVLLLRDIDEYSTREAASILGITANAVKTRLHRARAALRYNLESVLEQIDCHADL